GRRDPGDPRRLRARPLDRIRRLSATTPGSERPGRLGEYRGGRGAPLDVIYPGSDLLSHAVASGVPSAREGLTSVFGMGTGVAPPALPPGSRPGAHCTPGTEYGDPRVDRKSTRLNSSHVANSYAVFCLKKKTNTRHATPIRNNP